MGRGEEIAFVFRVQPLVGMRQNRLLVIVRRKHRACGAYRKTESQRQRMVVMGHKQEIDVKARCQRRLIFMFIVQKTDT